MLVLGNRLLMRDSLLMLGHGLLMLGHGLLMCLLRGRGRRLMVPVRRRLSMLLKSMKTTP